MTIAEFADPQEIVHAYLRDDLSLAQLTTVEVVDICAWVPDRCPVVILVLNESRGGDQLLAREEIGSIAQLRGRRVGVTFSTLGPYVLSRALEQEALLAPDGQLARNLHSVRALQQQLNLDQTDSVTPQVSNLVIQAALR